MSNTRKRLLARVNAPATEPVSLAEAKNYLRIDGANEDVLVADLIVAARLSAEQYLKASLITQSWKIAYDDYLEECVALPMGPVSSITSVASISRTGATQTISSSVYYLNASKDKILLDSPVFGDCVEVVYVAGYGDATQVPKPIKLGMLAHIAAIYDGRGDWSEAQLPAQTIALYAPFRSVVL